MLNRPECEQEIESAQLFLSTFTGDSRTNEELAHDYFIQLDLLSWAIEAQKPNKSNYSANILHYSTLCAMLAQKIQDNCAILPW